MKISKNAQLSELTGFDTEKAFTEKEFQTNQNVWVETVNYKSLMGVQVFSVPTEVINLYGKLQIRKYRHYGGQAV